MAITEKKVDWRKGEVDMLLGRFKELEENVGRMEFLVDGVVDNYTNIKGNITTIETKVLELSEQIKGLADKVKALEEKEVTEVTPQEERNIKMQNKDGLYSYQRYKSFVNGTRKEEE